MEENEPPWKKEQEGMRRENKRERGRETDTHRPSHRPGQRRLLNFFLHSFIHHLLQLRRKHPEQFFFCNTGTSRSDTPYLLSNSLSTPLQLKNMPRLIIENYRATIDLVIVVVVIVLIRGAATPDGASIN
jgi:hypothetical protein